jgi:hypothetical protein
LNLIMTEYEAYYELRFDKKPKLVRKLKDGEESAVRLPPPGAKKPPAASKSSKEAKPKPVAAAAAAAAASAEEQPFVSVADGGLGISGLGVKGTASDKKAAAPAAAAADDSDLLEHRWAAACGCIRD